MASKISGGVGIPASEVMEPKVSWWRCCCGCRKVRKIVPDSGFRIELKELSPEEIMAKFDVNKDGVLDARELNNLMQKIVVTDRTIEEQTKSSSDLHISIKRG